jgi:hypothetical protein
MDVLGDIGNRCGPGSTAEVWQVSQAPACGRADCAHKGRVGDFRQLVSSGLEDKRFRGPQKAQLFAEKLMQPSLMTTTLRRFVLAEQQRCRGQQRQT